ncbi:carotenoid oxygenase protein [Diplodia corticola]|uniref:Carotenoid oxygenase protein n=1 Tax=Diplodia corticola TaxID=236234 RepID=A0A1J9RSN8_9PEZI|nr:carotenoid oxygenase protein [Diplodia corticola]OJD31447.1 carotenoid oxygenase protein [Diplodia corticola]
MAENQVAQLQSQVEALTNRLNKVQDEAEVRKLHHKYGYYLDKCLYKQVVDLFADDPGTFVEFLGGRYRGKAGVRRLYIERFAQNFVRGRNGPVHGFLLDHAMMQDIIDVDPSGERAWGRWRALMSAGVHGSVADAHPRGHGADGTSPRQWWEGGVYENEYIKEGGVWKIWKYRYFAFWHGEHATGWALTKENYVPFAKTAFPDDPLGPDELVEQKMLWPDTRCIPFHYTHPVTGEQVDEDDLKAPAYGEDVKTAEPALSLKDG